MSSWGLRDNLLQIFFWETLANLNEKSFVGFVAQYMSEVKRSIHHSWVSLTFARKQQRKSFSSLIRLSYLKIIEPGFSRVYSAKCLLFRINTTTYLRIAASPQPWWRFDLRADRPRPWNEWKGGSSTCSCIAGSHPRWRGERRGPFPMLARPESRTTGKYKAQFNAAEHVHHQVGTTYLWSRR